MNHTQSHTSATQHELLFEVEERAQEDFSAHPRGELAIHQAWVDFLAILQHCDDVVSFADLMRLMTFFARNRYYRL